MNENALVTITQALTSEAMQQQLMTLLPKNVPVDRFTEVATMAIRKNPDILNADRQSLYDSCLTLARRGLLPDGKESALIVFNTNVGTRQQPKWIKQVQSMPMVEGIIKEMAKAGVKAYAMSVHANDTIDIWADDDGQHVKFKPVVFGDRGERVGAFAAAKDALGHTYVEAMNMEELEKIALRSKQARENNGQKVRGGTWATDPERMEQKSALHRLRKRIPILDDAAAQVLKDFEDESDIELETTELRGAPGNPEPSARWAPPDGTAPEQSGAETTASPHPARRPRALQAVVEQAKQAEAPQVPEEYQGEDII